MIYDLFLPICCFASYNIKCYCIFAFILNKSFKRWFPIIFCILYILCLLPKIVLYILSLQVEHNKKNTSFPLYDILEVPALDFMQKRRDGFRAYFSLNESSLNAASHANCIIIKRSGYHAVMDAKVCMDFFF